MTAVRWFVSIRLSSMRNFLSEELEWQVVRGRIRQMNTSSFKLYDLIVDIAPGIVVIGVLVPLFPAGSIVESLIDPSSFAFGVWVLFISYVVGRLVHGASSEIYDWCGWASNGGESFAKKVRRGAA